MTSLFLQVVQGELLSAGSQLSRTRSEDVAMVWAQLVKLFMYTQTLPLRRHAQMVLIGASHD